MWVNVAEKWLWSADKHRQNKVYVTVVRYQSINKKCYCSDSKTRVSMTNQPQIQDFSPIAVFWGIRNNRGMKFTKQALDVKNVQCSK